ncbi:hypothetical protein PVAND_015619 [Polypedilum vanderplanki]|uniref:Uncharacterized protein n=1 Tax=Polypedilum vanderplanki TaxID=319348 RepID=A0A9J6BD37_POLVA|nr:hypothetical protein PVAND_015619 [Polypedilum vanderplanki]
MTSSEERRILTRVKVDRDDEIIISGISGRFPNSKNVEELSYNLYNKIDMVDDVERRWKHLNDEMPKRYGKTVNLEKFDASFFSINYKQAHNMDPQARILQEHAYEAIMDAGVAPKSLRGSRTGVFISCCTTEVDEHFYFGTAIKDGMGLTGTSRALLANRISFSMDLKGPSFTIDSACSSSGYALDLAFNAIRTGECDAAIVGGTNLLLHPATTLQFFRLGVLSKDGYCRPFDKDALGYCRSEAITVVFLQKRKDAKRIYAELVYSKTNIDGFKDEGLTYPSGKIQTKLLAEFYKDLDIDPKTVDYVEAHCAGTKVGDPEECITLETIFCNDRTKPLLIGSVKSNMGHTEGSSSLCSIIKSILIFENRTIPPNIHFTAPRTDIPSLVDGRLKVVNKMEKFDGNLIGVNSFGFGGANFHCLVKRNPKQKENRGIPKDDIPRLVLWSGRTEEAVNAVLENISSQPLDAEFIALLQNSQISNPTLNTYRGYGIYAKDNENTKCLAHHVNNFASSKRPIVFVYSGMGSQWPQMGADLMKIPIFALTIEKCHNILIEKQINLKEIITSSDTLIFENILNSFVGIAAIQIGLTNIMNAIGLKPDFVIGHSVGELGCAYADNCLTEEEMILCAYSRGMASLESKVIYGAMAAVGVGYDELKNMLIDGIEIACHNSADSSTISGPSDLIDVFVKKLKEKNIFAKKVQTSNIAYHSSYIDPLGPNLLRRLKDVIKNPKKRSSKWICSSVPKENWNDFDCRFSSAQYHSNNLLNPVLFQEASEILPKDALTIEIAPHGLLQSITKRLLPDGLHFSLTKRGISDNSLYLIKSLGKIFENGVDMDISAIYPQIEFPVSSGTPMISPLIKWDHTENWFVPKYDDKEHNDMQIIISLQDSEYGFISGHEIDGRVLFPATGYLFLAWKLAALQNKEFFDKFDVEFEDVKFLRACNIPADPNGIKLTVVVQRGSGKFEIINGKSTVCTGIVRIASESKMRQFYHEDSKKIELKAKDFYKELRLRGYNYKGLFKSVISSQSDGSSGNIKWQSNWIVFLDCLLQLQILSRDTRSLVLPVGIKKLTIKTRDHLALASKLDKNGVFKAFYSSKLKILQCGGVEIRGVQTQTVNRRPPNGIPILESYQFIPHYKNLVLSKTDIARFCIQLAIENFATAKISAEIRELLDADIKKGIIKPLKMNVFNADEIVQAFKLLASGKHIGKVVLRMREMENSEKSVPISVLPKVYFNPNLCYIICGGLGGFGLELTDWLILRGCKNIILSSSRGITNDYQKIRISLWKSYGVKVIISTSDITTRDGCIELITTASNIAPVGGIFNLAVKLRDGILENQDAKTFTECMAPKALATKYLHEVSRSRCPLLHEFVVFSSVSCGRGNAGQSNYGMANSVMERIIEQRHKIGLPGKAIQWGAIGDVGIVADMQEDKNDLEIGGTLPQRISSCLEVLDTLMTVKNPIVSSMVVAEKHNKNSGKDGIVKMIMNIMSIKDVKSLSIETKLSELGMDSLMTVEISQALEREFNLYITSQELRSITLQQLNALEKDGHFDEIENPINKFQFLLPSLDEEKEAYKSIIKLESNNNNGDKVLLITGIEGVGGKNYKNFARNLNNPTYLLQMSSCWYAKSLDEMYSAVVDDVLKLYDNEKSFLLIGYSFGSILTLKLVNALESKGKTGKVILIDGSPKLMQQIVLQFLPSKIKNDNDMENLVLKHYFRLIFPKERTDRLSKILQEITWEEKMLKVEEIFANYNSNSIEFIKNLFFGLLQRIKIAANLNLKSFNQLNSPITLIKPNEITLHEIEDDYGLQIYTKNNIQINSLKGNHSNIIENVDLSTLVNKIFS